MLVFGLLQCGLIITMYNHMIKTEAIKSINEIPFKATEFVDVLQEKRFKLLIDDFVSWYYLEILNSTRSPYYEIRQTLEDNPLEMLSVDLLENELNEFFKRLNERKNLIGIVDSDQELAFNVDKHCNLVLLEVCFLVL